MPFGQRAAPLPVHCVLSWQPFPTSLGLLSVTCQRIAWHPGAHSAKREWLSGHAASCPSWNVRKAGSAGVWQTDHAMSDRGGGQSGNGSVEGCLLGNTDLLAATARKIWQSNKMLASIIQCSLFPPCRFVRDERRHHLHGEESGLGVG